MGWFSKIKNQVKNITKGAAQEAKESQAAAAHADSLQQQQPAKEVNAAAANLAQGTGGAVVEDIF